MKIKWTPEMFVEHIEELKNPFENAPNKRKLPDLATIARNLGKNGGQGIINR